MTNLKKIINLIQNSSNNNTFIICSFLVTIFLTTGLILTAPVSHDEHMYLAASKLLNTYSMYSDFSYVQTPYMPYIYNFFMTITGNTYILLIACCVNTIIVI